MDRNVLLLHDTVSTHAPPDELDTLDQLVAVESTLRALGYETTRKPFDGDLLALEHHLQTNRFDVVFNLVETYHGSRFLHLIPLLCEQLGIPVTGGSSESLFLTSDKLLAKRLLVLAGIPTPQWITRDNRDQWSSFLGRRLLCKPRGEEASVGIDDTSVLVCDTLYDMEILVERADAEGLMIERFIDGREYNISILPNNGKPEVLPIAEMVFADYPPDKPKIVGYEAKWLEDSFAYTHTVRSFGVDGSDAALAGRLHTVAEETWRLFGGNGYARVDLRLDEQGNMFVLELNANPCIAHDSGFFAAANEAGYTYNQMVESIVQEAFRG
jgi:D-alanine-D-alanine ligase